MKPKITQQQENWAQQMRTMVVSQPGAPGADTLDLRKPTRRGKKL